MCTLTKLTGKKLRELPYQCKTVWWSCPASDCSQGPRLHHLRLTQQNSLLKVSVSIKSYSRDLHTVDINRHHGCVEIQNLSSRVSRVSAADKWNIFQHLYFNHVIFFLLCKMFTIHNNICGDFPRISQDFLKLLQRPDKHFAKITQLKIAKEDWRRFECVLIIHQQI